MYMEEHVLREINLLNRYQYLDGLVFDIVEFTKK